MRLLAIAGAVMALSFSATAQTPAPAASHGGFVFEVASVKLDTTGGGRGVPVMDAQRLIWRGATLKRMICEAYKVQYAQVLGAPAWSDTERYEVEARAEKPSSRDQLRQMLRSLLAERFHLAIRTESKPLPVYVLGVSKKGVKLREVPLEEQNSPADRPAINQFTRRATMAQLAGLLSQMMSGPVFNGYTGRMESREEPPAMVVDQTGLNGVYDIHLDLNGVGDGDLASTLGTSLAADGLKLDIKRLPVDILSVTRAERIPTKN